MIGAIIGDIVGSRFEFNNHRDKDFELFTDECSVTDDSIMTIFVAKALLECNGDYSDLSNKTIKSMQGIGRLYPNCGYGGYFNNWIFSENPKPYNSYGNGAAMRISPVGFVTKNIAKAKELSRNVTEISHSHPEGIKGAESVAVAIVLARQGKSIEEIKEHINKHYYKIDFILDEIRDTYTFNATCQGSVPQAFEAFFESTDFEDAIRNAISIGGDSDTLAAITGGIAEAYYGVPMKIRKSAESYLDSQLLKILITFENYIITEKEKEMDRFVCSDPNDVAVVFSQCKDCKHLGDNYCDVFKKEPPSKYRFVDRKTKCPYKEKE